MIATKLNNQKGVNAQTFTYQKTALSCIYSTAQTFTVKLFRNRKLEKWQAAKVDAKEALSPSTKIKASASETIGYHFTSVQVTVEDEVEALNVFKKNVNCTDSFSFQTKFHKFLMSECQAKSLVAHELTPVS